MYKPALALMSALLLALSGGLSAASPQFKNLYSGEFVTLDDYQRDGNWLVVMIWASDCEICKREAGSYQRFHSRSSPEDTRVIGLSLDGAEGETAARAFVARHGDVLLPAADRQPMGRHAEFSGVCAGR